VTDTVAKIVAKTPAKETKAAIILGSFIIVMISYDFAANE
jgi:hypothetical protein